MKISVIVTAYNYADFLPACLDSVFNQTLDRSCFEVIVVDDNSSDHTQDCLSCYRKNPDFHVLHNNKNLGVAGAANQGIAVAKGKYIVRVDADDYVSHNFLEDLVTPLEQNQNIFACACDYTLVDLDDQPLETKSARDDPIACGVMYEKQRFLALGAYNEQFRTYEHQEFILRMTGENIFYLSSVLYYYRRHTQNQSKPSAWRASYKARLDALQSAATVD